MEYVLPLSAFAIVHLLAVISPGPSFVLVTQLAASRSRSAAMAAALAMTVGAVFWAAAALVGLQALFARFETLYFGMRLIGGAYLIWIGLQLFRGAGASRPTGGDGHRAEENAAIFRYALLVQLSNPKVAVFFSSIFLAMLPSGAPVYVLGSALAIVAVNEFGWYATLALLFSTERPQLLYLRAKMWVDRGAGLVLGGLGLRLILDRS